MISEQEAKSAVIEAGKMLLSEKLTARTWGNVSCRTGEKSFVITPSGLSYEKTTVDDLVSYDMATGQWRGARKPSSERGIHLAAYEIFPDAGFVIHTHQTYASAIGMAGFYDLKLSNEEEAVLGKIALARYGLPSTKKLVENAKNAFKSNAKIVLMYMHGAIIAAKDKDEAFYRAKLLEEVCKRAAKGQPDMRGAKEKDTAAQPFPPSNSMEKLEELTKQAAPYFPFTDCACTPAAAEVSRISSSSFPAQLDDMAQMIGSKLITVDNNVKFTVKALKKYPAILVKDLGVICRAKNKSDCDALKLLVEKACVCYLHTKALNVKRALSPIDRALMRFVYLSKYSKKSEG